MIRDNPGRPVPEETFTHSHPSGSEICIVIDDKSQGSIAKHLRSDELGLLYDAFIIQSAGERIFKIGQHLAMLQAEQNG